MSTLTKEYAIYLPMDKDSREVVFAGTVSAVNEKQAEIKARQLYGAKTYRQLLAEMTAKETAS